MVEVTVTERTREHGRRIRELREGRGIGKGRLLDALGFGSSQSYDLYERGISVIRLDRLEDWADAFGMGVLDFINVVVLGAPDPIPALRLRVIDALGPEAERRTPEYIDEVTLRLSQQDEDVREDALRELYADKHAGVPSSC